MDSYIINGGRELAGEINIDGAKNAVLPILAATLLTSGSCCINNVPELNDVIYMFELLKLFGASILKIDDKTYEINTEKIKNYTAPYEIVSKMRASFLVMGPLLARMGKAKIALPGGCRIGVRPIDLHLKGFSLLGTSIKQGFGYIEARTQGFLKGDHIYLDLPSVGATENIMMAAVLADGVTVIENAATEPEIVDLANFLIKMGAQITGAGTDSIRIKGVAELKGCSYTVIPDRIEAGTYMVAAASCGGELVLNNIISAHQKPLIAKLRECGVSIIEYSNSLKITSSGKLLSTNIKTLPYPGFPTDMQAQMMAMLSKAKGTSIVVETIFENRFMHVCELQRMGARINIEGHTAVIEGGNLQAAEVSTTDLRAGAALIIAGLSAKGKTVVLDEGHIRRGYVDIVSKLSKVGADIFYPGNKGNN